MATTTEKVTEKVSEVLLGTTEEPGLSKDDRAIFQHFAKQDEDGVPYLDEEQFVNAIAPQSEDYVSMGIACAQGVRKIRLLTPPILAQNQPLAICHPLPRRRPQPIWKSHVTRLDSVRQYPTKARRRVRNRFSTIRHNGQGLRKVRRVQAHVRAELVEQAAV